MILSEQSDIEIMALRSEMALAYHKLTTQIAQVDAEIARRVEAHKKEKHGTKHHSSGNAGDSLD